MKIKGFGGVFWRTRNVEALRKWYAEALGLNFEDWNGTVISPETDSMTIFSMFAEDDASFPTEQLVMLNFQVENMSQCLAHLKRIGVPLVKEAEKSEFGSFAWIADPEGRWIELWEKP